FVTLDRLLVRLNANKPELLMVLDRPEIPLHTNGSENDIRCHVTRRKVSGGTRSDVGRDCRDAFLGLAKTCAKLEIAFWDYLGARLAVPGSHVIPPLPQIILPPRIKYLIYMAFSSFAGCEFLRIFRGFAARAATGLFAQRRI